MYLSWVKSVAMNEIQSFGTELYFEQYEFNVQHQLCNSDCETVSVAELCQMADIPVAAIGDLHLGYTEAPGNPDLRAALASAYATAQADDLMILGTPIEGIYLTARTLLASGDEVIVLSPAYDALINMFAHVVGADNVARWRLTSTEGNWSLDLNALEALITAKTKLVVVNFPHNPTGYLPSPEWQAEFISILRKHDLYLFQDEMYFGLNHQGTPSMASAADVYEKSIVLSGLSKTYGLPGLRSGWLVVQDKALYQTLKNWKFYTSICPPAPTEFLAQVAWQVRDQLKQRNLEIIEMNKRLARDFCQRWPDLFTWHNPVAGSTALVDVHVPSVTAYADQLVREAGVLILPTTSLDYGDGAMRVGLGRKAFGAALAELEQYLKRHS